MSTNTCQASARYLLNIPNYKFEFTRKVNFLFAHHFYIFSFTAYQFLKGNDVLLS